MHPFFKKIAEVRPVLTFSIFLATCAFFVVTLIEPSMVTRYALATSNPSPYQYVTYIFMHGYLGHLLSNMLCLLVFGIMAETVLTVIGRRGEFILLYFTGGIAGALVQVFFLHAGKLMLGASGAVASLMGACFFIALMRWRDFGLSWWIVRAPLIVWGLFWLSLQAYGLIGLERHTAHVAHLVGFACGLIYAWWRMRIFDDMAPLDVDPTVSDAEYVLGCISADEEK